MAKSKSKNRNRAKLLKQRKKEREKAGQGSEIIGLPQIEKRLKNQLGANINFNNRSLSPVRKISDVVTEMINPVMREARDFEEQKKIIGLGITAWNLGIVKTHNGEKEILKLKNSFKKAIPKELVNLIIEFSEVKCTDYSEYDELIIDWEFTHLNDHQNNLTVSYKLFNE
ncbi:MAG: hypothetical protein DRJ05_18875 [Bacteroidetes bacterium]|nr:MAG: hypothetical protein DRJ05_18875 [Bacteroidota bacterium]